MTDRHVGIRSESFYYRGSRSIFTHIIRWILRVVKLVMLAFSHASIRDQRIGPLSGWHVAYAPVRALPDCGTDRRDTHTAGERRRAAPGRGTALHRPLLYHQQIVQGHRGLVAIRTPGQNSFALTTCRTRHIIGERVHVPVLSGDGEATLWLDPERFPLKERA